MAAAGRRALLVGLVALGAAPAAGAATLLTGDTAQVPSGEWIADDLYVAGGTVQLFGLVDGDVIAAGSTVIVDGRITGDLLAAGGTIIVRGRVDGAIRVAGGTVTVPGRVGDDVVVAAGRADLGGRVDGDVLVTGGAVSLAGAVGGDVHARAGRLELGDGAQIDGVLHDGSRSGALVAPRAVVSGGVVPAVAAAPSPAERVQAFLRSLIGLLATGLLVRLVAPRFVNATTERLAYRPGASLGVGLLVAVFVPFVAVLTTGVGALVGGWWLGVVVLGLLALGLLTGVTLAALQLGRWGAELLGRLVGDAAALAAGLGLLLLANALPLAGPVLLSLAALCGLGAQTLAWLQRRRTVLGTRLPGDLPAPPAPPPTFAPPRAPTPA